MQAQLGQLICWVGVVLGFSFSEPCDAHAGLQNDGGLALNRTIFQDSLYSEDLGFVEQIVLRDGMAIAQQSTPTSFAQSLPDVADVLSYEFIAELDGFAVQMPSPPVAQPLPQDEFLNDGAMYVQIRVEEDNQLAILVVGYAEFAGELTTPGAVDRALNGFLLSFASGNDVTSPRALELDGYRGLEVEGRDRASLNIMRAYVVDEQFYFLGVFLSPFALFSTLSLEPPDIIAPDWVAPYFDSFRLLQ